MKPAQKKLFDKNLLTMVADRFGVSQDTIKSLGGFENYVCQCEKDGSPYILRISHQDHRDSDQIIAELDWVKYLADNSASVCVPILSLNNSLVEVISTDSDSFSAVMFEKAPGGHAKRTEMNDEMIINRGQLIGKIHHLTKSYEPASENKRRPDWYNDDDFLNYAKYLPAQEKLVCTRLAQLIERLRNIKIDSESYNLIHQDAHSGNMFFEKNRPTLFDFDDCSYDFFVSDIAISLFYALLGHTDKNERKEYAVNFLTNFLAGYRLENQLSHEWLDLIPLILKRREIVLYVAIHRGMDLDNLDEFCTQYLKERKHTIENEIPFLELNSSDFS